MRSTTCVILQPSYIPWRGHFDQIHQADVFVFYDDVPYDTRGWRNRNRVKSREGPRWLTIPVQRKGVQPRRTPIHDIAIDDETDWRRKHWETLRHLYGRAPHFDRYASLVRSFYEGRPARLADFTIDLTKRLAGALGIRDTRFLRSSEIERPEARKTADLLAIVQQLGATTYLTGPAARNYLDEATFSAAGIDVRYMKYDYPSYPQLYPPFVSEVTILDLLFMVGDAAPAYIWDRER